MVSGVGAREQQGCGICYRGGIRTDRRWYERSQRMGSGNGEERFVETGTGRRSNDGLQRQSSRTRFPVVLILRMISSVRGRFMDTFGAFRPSK